MEEHVIGTKNYYKTNVYFMGQERQEIIDSNQPAISQALNGNHAIGLIAGYYEKNLPICYVCENMLHILEHTPTTFWKMSLGYLINIVDSSSQKYFDVEDMRFFSQTRKCRMRGRYGDYVEVYVTNIYSEDANGCPMWVLTVRMAGGQQDGVYTFTDSEEGQSEKSLQMLSRELQNQKRIVKTLSKLNYVNYIVNLTEGTFHEISSIPQLQLVIGKFGVLRNSTDKILDIICTEDSRAQMELFMDPVSLKKRLHQKPHLQMKFTSRHQGGCLAHYIVVDPLEEQDLTGDLSPREKECEYALFSIQYGIALDRI